MPQQIRSWEGKEWEAYILALLKMKYGVRDFQSIPDGHGGDFGLEGFSTDGCAYQCFAPQEPLSTRERYEKQRNKITEDLNKFVYNSDGLKKILGTTVICRWILLVPEHDSAQLNQHAETKAAEVRERCLPYVDADFKVHIGTDSFFERERRTLAADGGAQIRLVQNPVDVEQISQWASENSGLIGTLVEKLKKLPRGKVENDRVRLQLEWMKHYLGGENLLSRLHLEYPEVFEKIHKCKADREDFLATDSLISMSRADKMLSDTLKEFMGELAREVKGLDPADIRRVTYSIIADWLLRCPLDFPEVADD